MHLVFQKKCKKTDVVRYVCLRCKQAYNIKTRICPACKSPFVIKIPLNVKIKRLKHFHVEENFLS